MRLAKVKRFVVDIIEPKKKANVLSIIYNILMSLLVIASCVCVFIDLFAEEGTIWDTIAQKVELIAVIAFAAEYLLKLFAAEALYEGQGWFKSKISYITSFDSFIDIVCILSIFLNQIPKEFAVLRLLKLVKLTRLIKLKDAVDEIRDVDNQSEEKVEKKKGLRKRVHEIIFKDEKGDKLSKAYDIVSIIIILLSVATIVLDTFTFPETVTNVIFYSEVVFTVFFAIDYILRVWTAEFEYPETDPSHAKMKYIFSLMAIIDLISILPVFFTFSVDAEAALPRTVAILKVFKLLKIARLLKMSRYLNSINLFVAAVKNKKKQIFFSVAILLFLIVLSSILLYSFEDAAGNDQFQNGFSGLLYATTILTGFGQSDMEVVSVGGQVMVILMIISGACVVGVPLGIISGEFTTMVAHAADQDEKEEPDLFEEFSKDLSTEDKLKIIAEYSKKEVLTEENKSSEETSAE